MKVLRKHKASIVFLLVGLGLGLVLSGHVVTNVSAIPREDYESLETFTNRSEERRVGKECRL